MLGRVTIRLWFEIDRLPLMMMMMNVAAADTNRAINPQNTLEGPNGIYSCLYMVVH